MQEVAKETRRFIFCGKSSSATLGVTKKKKNETGTKNPISLKANFKLELIPLLHKRLRKLNTVNYRLQAPPSISPPPLQL